MKRLSRKVFTIISAGMLAFCCFFACSHNVTGDSNSSSVNGTSYSLALVGSGVHDTTSYTEGLFWYDDKLCESTGKVGKSCFYKNIDYTTGNAEESINLPEDVFGEGSVVLDGVLYVLTYKNRVAYRYDFDTLILVDEVTYPREGWGLTTDGEWLYASDGSDDIVVMDKDLSVKRSIAVTEDGVPVTNINELEYIDGYIWANVWMTGDVIVVDPTTGYVVQRIDLLDILPDSAMQYKKTADDVLNGLAYNAESDTLFVTGKRMPEIYELSLDR